MKTIKFNYIKISDFCNIKELSGKMFLKTVIKGKNAVGKSTVKKCIQFVLNTRDENGKEINGIRPHDKNGIDIDGLVTRVELTVSDDGVENTLRKDFYQKKNRKGEYNGEDATEYYVDDVKKRTKKAYDEFVQTIIPNEVCINANVLIEKDTATRRSMLLAFGKHTMDDIIAENSLFEPIAGKVKANSVSDIKKSLREKIKGSKNKEGLEDELKKINIQIDIEKSKKHDINASELELYRNVLKEQIKEIEKKENNISEQLKDYQKLSDGILELKFQESDLIRNANAKNEQRRNELKVKIDNNNAKIRQTENQISSYKNTIKGLEKKIDYLQKNVTIYREQWKIEKERVFDDGNLICSYCGRKYTEDKKEHLKKEFEENKQKVLDTITENGIQVKNELEEAKKLIKNTESKILEAKKIVKKLNHETSNFLEEYLKLPKRIDVSNTEEYKNIGLKITEKENALKKMQNGDSIRQKLKEEKEELKFKLDETNRKISLYEENVNIDERILKLQNKQREVSQQIADIESEIDLLKDFERKMAEALEKDVNSYFEYAQVKMFDTYQNGEIKDICEFYVKGTAYSRGLNHGARMLTEIDICRAFQKLYDIECPIIIEDSESLDSDRIPQIDNQLIMLKRTDDDKLIIEEVR